MCDQKNENEDAERKKNGNCVGCFQCLSGMLSVSQRLHIKCGVWSVECGEYCVLLVVGNAFTTLYSAWHRRIIYCTKPNRTEPKPKNNQIVCDDVFCIIQSGFTTNR